jgi:hypothetical protein
VVLIGARAAAPPTTPPPPPPTAALYEFVRFNNFGTYRTL